MMELGTGYTRLWDILFPLQDLREGGLVGGPYFFPWIKK